MPLQIVILAAGQGKRMYSDVPKVLHPIAGKSMLERVVDTAQQLHPEAIHVVYGHGGEQIKQTLSHLNVNWVLQPEQLGTGHALLQALPFVDAASEGKDCQVLVLSGDVPLIQADTLQALVSAANDSGSLTLLVAHNDDPSGLGRILRDEKQQIYAIIEEKDATPAQRQIKEIYSGICCAKNRDLNRWLPQLKNHNAQGEYYITDIIGMAVEEQQCINSQQTHRLFEIQGVNNRLQLQQLERAWQLYQAEELLLKGVTLADANRIDIRGNLICGKDVFIDINCIFSGQVVLGDGCRVGPNCSLSNVIVGDHCELLANSVIDSAQLGRNCHIGPFARLRPGTRLSDNCKIGNFVETKNAVFDTGSKASHLSYLGDVTLGKEVNIGAGTITCNYDGVNKHQTTIEDGVFVGSDTQFVAPVTIGANATIGAGSTIRRNVPAGELTLTESKQKTLYGWKRPLKKT